MAAAAVAAGASGSGSSGKLSRDALLTAPLPPPQPVLWRAVARFKPTCCAKSCLHIACGSHDPELRRARRLIG